MAHLDAHITGDQEVTGSTPEIFFVEIDHEIFSTVSLPSDSRRAAVSFWRKNVQNTG